MCGRLALLPRAMRIPVCYDRSGSALYRGEYVDVWKGEYCGREVMVKVTRAFSNSRLLRVIGVSCFGCTICLCVSELTESCIEVL